MPVLIPMPRASVTTTTTVVAPPERSARKEEEGPISPPCRLQRCTIEAGDVNVRPPRGQQMSRQLHSPWTLRGPVIAHKRRRGGKCLEVGHSASYDRRRSVHCLDFAVSVTAYCAQPAGTH